MAGVQRSLLEFYFDDKTLLLYRVLGGGARLTQAAKVAGVSKQLARYYAAKWEKEGILRRVARWPALWEGQSKRISSWGSSNPQKSSTHLFTPHRFGASFFIVRRPQVWHNYQKEVPLTGRYGGKWYRYIWHEGDFTIIAYPSKVTIWCFAFPEHTTQEQLTGGAQRIKERALAFQREQGCSLAYDSPAQQNEWVVKNKELSDKLRQVLRLDNTPVHIAQAKFMIDTSHPNNVEIADTKATTDITNLEWLLVDGKPTIAASAEMLRLMNGQMQDMMRIQGDILTYLKLRQSP